MSLTRSLKPSTVITKTAKKIDEEDKKCNNGTKEGQNKLTLTLNKLDGIENSMKGLKEVEMKRADTDRLQAETKAKAQQDTSNYFQYMAEMDRKRQEEHATKCRRAHSREVILLKMLSKNGGVDETAVERVACAISLRTTLRVMRRERMSPTIPRMWKSSCK